MRISIELVPRSREILLAEAHYLRAALPQIETVNIPDLLRMELRSWEACAALQGVVPQRIAHIRAIDCAPDRPLPFAATVRAHGLQELILITGDAPQTPGRQVWQVSPLELLRRIRAELPGVKLYAALDPYRQSLRAELEYTRTKLEAGFDGIFTQPFFDIRLMEIYAQQLAIMGADAPIFWGLSPVTTASSRAYWETKNHAVFPRDFEPTLAWNVAFARRALVAARELGGHAYIMPIRVELTQYLPPIFAP